MNQLFPYQEEGRDFLASNERAYIAHAPGLGKTIMAIRALTKVKSKRPLVICPASVVGSWKAEWQIWGDPKVVLSVLSYSKLVADEKYRHAIAMVKPDVLVLDEAHYVRNADAQRTAWTIGNGQNASLIDVMDSLRHIWLLSGTPDPNTPFELHHTLRQLWPERLRQHAVWRADYWLDMFEHYPGYVVPGGKPPKPMIVGMTPQGAKKLKSILEPIMLRRTLKQVGHQLPDLDIRVSPLKLLTAELDTSDLDPDSEEHISTARRLLGEAKAPVVAAILAEELENDLYHKIVVFAWHKKALKILERALSKFGLVKLDGSTSESDRTEAVELFQADYSIRVFLAQQVAGGIGITLTAAPQVVLCEPSWVPDENIQAIKRVHRIGQDQHVYARLFTVAGTLDDDIIRTNHRKRNVKLDLEIA